MTDAEFVKPSMVTEPPAQFGGKWTLDKAEDVVTSAAKHPVEKAKWVTTKWDRL